MKELEIEAVIENFAQVQAFVDKQIKETLCKMKAQMQISIAVEEIFVNIAHYAYTPNVGLAKIQVEAKDGKVKITFIDNGKKYNPLENPEPDTTASAEEREIGGLGIFMVKKSMDDVIYDYKDGRNILSIVKNIS